jgi:hypothetical protein
MSLDRRLEKLGELLAEQRTIEDTPVRQLARRLMAQARTERDTLPSAGPAEKTVAKLLGHPAGTRFQPAPEPEWNGDNAGMEMLRLKMRDEERKRPTPAENEATRKHRERLEGLTPRLDGLESRRDGRPAPRTLWRKPGHDYEIQRLIEQDELVVRDLLDNGYWVESRGKDGDGSREKFALFDPNGMLLCMKWGKEACEAAAKAHS